MLPDRYTVPEIANDWSEASNLARRIRVWRAASAAIGHPWSWTDSLAAIYGRATELEEKYGHDTAAQCEALREWLVADGQIEAARWLHYGLCSSDVADSALVLTIRSVTSGIRDVLGKRAADALRTLAIEQIGTPAVYRTHGQAAVVADGAARWNGLLYRLRYELRELTRTADAVPLPAFNGPVGVSGVLTPQRAQIARMLEDGPRFTATGTQAVGRERIVAWCQNLTRITDLCAQFGTNVRLLAATGVDEVTEGRGSEYRGSSSMPHKTNPTQSERLCGLAGVARGLAMGYQNAASVWWDSHSLEHSIADRVLLPDLSGLAGYALAATAKIASELVTHPVFVAVNIETAPEDSFARRNALIESGVDGGDAWSQARNGR